MMKVLMTIVIAISLLFPFTDTKQIQAHKNPFTTQNEFEHRYVIFLNGINSQSSENTIPLDGKFEKMQKALEKKGVTNFVYFSYSGTALSNPRFCDGWGKKGCAEGTFGQLSSLNLSPEYSKSDTKLSVDLQADTLNWLIGEIVRVDQDAEIYLIGFSLGGIVSSHWASRINLFDYTDYVKGILIINSPVGGIPLAGPMLEGCEFTEFICSIWRGALLQIYGETVLAQLQLPVSNPQESLIDTLPGAAQKFSMTSIQSAHDYTVNGQMIPLCNGILCKTYDDVPVGNGSQYWPRIVNLHNKPLGGIGLAEKPIKSKVELINLLRKNHNASLQHNQTITWAVDAVTQAPDVIKYAAKASEFIYDIVTSGETAILEFNVQNIGQEPWNSSEYEFTPVYDNNIDNLKSFSLPTSVVNPGEVVTFEIKVQDVSGNSFKTIRYQMTYQGKPFEETITGYIFIIPEDVKDIEEQIRKKIDEWIAKGGQEIQELIDMILEEIQRAIEKQAQKFLEELLRQCLPTNSLIALGTIFAYFRRKSRDIS